MSDTPRKPLITPAMMAALAAPIPNFHVMWERYRTSSFRRDWLATWAGDDVDKQNAVRDLLKESEGREPKS